MNTVTLPPSMMRAKSEPISTISGEAPISRRMSGANQPNSTPRPADTVTPSITICAAECAARSGSFSPIRRATIAVAANEMPMATA